MRTSLFGDQDVTQSFLEKKHETIFNPIVLHYTTKDEEKFADWKPEFSQLSRSQEEREDSVIQINTKQLHKHLISDKERKWPY